MAVSSPSLLSRPGESKPSLWPWRNWSLEIECSTRPADTLHVAFQALHLVAAKHAHLIKGILDELLILQLKLHFASVLQTEWKPTKRQFGVLSNFWQCGLNDTLPSGTKAPETQFYQHGGLVALAALGMAICANMSVLKDLAALQSNQVIAIIESVKNSPRHPSVDKEFEKVTELHQLDNSQYSFFQRQERAVPKTLLSEPQSCPRCQPTQGQEQLMKPEAFSTHPTPSLKRQRTSGPDLRLWNSPNGGQSQEAGTRCTTSQSSTAVLAHPWQPSLIRPPVVLEDQFGTHSQSRAGYSETIIVQSTSSGSGTLPLAEALDPTNTHSIHSQLPARQQEELLPRLAASGDTIYSFAPGVEQKNISQVQRLESRLRDRTTECAEGPEITYLSPAAPEEQEERDWTRNHSCAQWKQVQPRIPEAQGVQGKDIAYSNLAAPALAEDQEESGDWTMSHSTSKWKQVQLRIPGAQYVQGKDIAYSNLAVPPFAEDQEESGDWTISHGPAQWKQVQPKNPEAHYMQGQNIAYSCPAVPPFAEDQEESGDWTMTHGPAQWKQVPPIVPEAQFMQ